MIDAVILTILTIVIAYQPFYLHGRVNEFELGLYLPGINGILDGLIPYKDFFHLRGPLELYIPAFFMSLFGKNVAVLMTYFYVGTLITLILGILIARHLYRTRLVLYLMAFVFIGRTFPRVIFSFWGGLRFGWGLLSVLGVVCYYKKDKPVWLLGAGVAAGLAFLTSVEMGAAAFLSILLTGAFFFILSLQPKARIIKDLSIYTLGFMGVLIPYSLYLMATKSLLPYFQDLYIVVSQMPKAIPIHLVGDTPNNPVSFLRAMLPNDPHFKHLTPVYCYVFFAFYIGWRLRKRDIQKEDLGIIHVAFYGLIMYYLAFRNIGAGQFEMALQPEKIVLFFLLESIFLSLRTTLKSISLSKGKKWGARILIALFILSSLGYSFQRYGHRFPSVRAVGCWVTGQDVAKLKPLADDASRLIELPRVQGLTVPLDQAEDWEETVNFMEKYTQPDDRVFMFPELGFYSFLIDRPFVGRFPMATFSWFAPGWPQALKDDLISAPPKFILMSNELPKRFDDIYFKVPQNKENYDDIRSFIDHYYERVFVTPQVSIYQRLDVSSLRG